jgi:threonyl-tRNA synthetase
MPKFTLPGGAVVERPAPTTAGEVLAAGPDAANTKKAVAAKVNGQVVDLSRRLDADASIEPVMPGTAEGLDVLRHTTAHVMAQAVARHFGMDSVEFAIGPVIDEGFYYDFDLPRRLTPEDLPAIEKIMGQIKDERIPIVREEAKDRDDALAKIRGDRAKSKFKQELISGFPAHETVSFYRQGEFMDLCRGPHLPSTGRLGAFKLLSVAGAYWRGDEKRDQLQRIYATAFFGKDELAQFVHRREEAEKRDHRKVGTQLQLFALLPEAPGFPLWLPNGTIVFNELVTEMRRKLRERDYVEVRTPHIMNADLWKRSGHWDHYKDNMYFTEIEERSFAVKPMNCPGSALVFAQGLRSYRELPLRVGEFGLCHRYEESGALAGMTRVRSFVQDDGHVYCTLEQVPGEIRSILDLIHEVYSELGMSKIHMFLATRPADRAGSDEMWDRAEAALAEALRSGGYEFKVNPGDGAFYGPKIDFQIEDAIGRGHQTATCQADFGIAEKFGLEYVADDGSRQRPVVIHRAIYGSIERFFAILIEHFAGNFPLWLAPEQAVIAPVSEDRHADAAKAALAKLKAAGLRASVDWNNAKLGKKIREIAMRKVPYILVIGDREAQDGTVAVRRRDGADCGVMSVADCAAKLCEEVRTRALVPSIGPAAAGGGTTSA